MRERQQSQKGFAGAHAFNYMLNTLSYYIIFKFMFNVVFY